MKIDYDKIIEQANVRKDKLKALEELLAGTHAHITAARQAMYHFQELKHALEQLDDEGRKLLPQPLFEVGYSVGVAAGSFLQHRRYNQPGSALSELANLVEWPQVPASEG